MPYHFSFTPAIIRYLQTIERVRQTVHLTILPPATAELLRQQAHFKSTHYSTRIEGNRLTLKETEQVIQQGLLFPGRERDVSEVERYYRALQQIEKWVEGGQSITETRIRSIHAVLYRVKRAVPTPYRDGQNVIRSSNGEIIYMPPEAPDVPKLMAELVDWIHTASGEMPVPVIAGLAHYQFVTIHPFYDGNGRAARLLTTWILFRGGYDLGKFYALEEFYVQNLEGYYGALVTHPHHNYYFGRDQAEITPWLEYFLQGMSMVFEHVENEVRSSIRNEEGNQNEEYLRLLDYRARRVLALFAKQEMITSMDVARLLGLSPRQVRMILTEWTVQGWLVVVDPSRRGRKYRLSPRYQQLL